MYFLLVIKANFEMQYKNFFHSKVIYLSLLVWPVILFINAYYSYFPFIKDSSLKSLGLSHTSELFIFMFTGFMAMIFFGTLVQSSFQFSYLMRASNTLELLYLSPASRFAALLGNALGSLFGSVWLLIVFSVGMFIDYSGYLQFNTISVVVSIGLLLALAITWGVFLNSLFLITRDNGFLYTILESPMEIFSGVKLPFELMPMWAQIVGFLFPLTYIISVLRSAIIYKATPDKLQNSWLICLVIAIILVAASKIFIEIGERHVKKTGSATLF